MSRGLLGESGHRRGKIAPPPPPPPPPSSGAHKVGIYIAGGSSGVAAFEASLGKPVNLVHQYMPPSTSQSTLNAWASYSTKMLISLDMLNGNTMTMAQIASGQADAVYKTFGQRLVTAGMPNCIIRIGWEANGSWMTWAYSKTTAANWVAAFRHIVLAMRGAAGQSFRFEWNLAQGKVIDPNFYAGDDVIDIIGNDMYAGYTTNGTNFYNSKQSRDDWYNGKAGQTTPSYLAFVRAHKKLAAVSEWGMWNKDDATYMAECRDRYASWPELEYHVYFNVDGHDAIEHRMPTPYALGWGVFKAAYGA